MGEFVSESNESGVGIRDAGFEIGNSDSMGEWGDTLWKLFFNKILRKRGIMYRSNGALLFRVSFLQRCSSTGAECYKGWFLGVA